jgi:hypothetical protein
LLSSWPSSDAAIDFTSRAVAFMPRSTLPATDDTLSPVCFVAAVEVALAAFAAVALLDDDRLVFEADLPDTFTAVALVDEDRLGDVFEAVLADAFAGDLVIDRSPFQWEKRATARFGSSAALHLRMGAAVFKPRSILPPIVRRLSGEAAALACRRAARGIKDMYRETIFRIRS